MGSKQFSQSLHDLHDPQIRSLVVERLPYALGLLDPDRFSWSTFRENPDKYGVDLLGVTEQGEIIHAEVEHKTSERWNTTFPFPTLDIPYRKKKFAESANPTVFVVVNHNYSQMAVTIASVLMMLQPQKKNNVYANGELFYAVPLEYVRFCPLRGWA